MEAFLNSFEMQYKEDLEFKKLFHSIRKNMFESLNLLDLKRQAVALLEMSIKIDHKKIYDPMSNFEEVNLELQSMLYGINNWEIIKSCIINNPGIKQTELIKTANLDKNKTSLFLYRISLFGLLKKMKIKNRNAYEYMGEKLDPKITKSNWENMWEIPYKEYESEF